MGEELLAQARALAQRRFADELGILELERREAACEQVEQPAGEVLGADRRGTARRRRRRARSGSSRMTISSRWRRCASTLALCDVSSSSSALIDWLRGRRIMLAMPTSLSSGASVSRVGRDLHRLAGIGHDEGQDAPDLAARGLAEDRPQRGPQRLVGEHAAVDHPAAHAEVRVLFHVRPLRLVRLAVDRDEARLEGDRERGGAARGERQPVVDVARREVVARLVAVVAALAGAAPERELAAVVGVLDDRPEAVRDAARPRVEQRGRDDQLHRHVGRIRGAVRERDDRLADLRQEVLVALHERGRVRDGRGAQEGSKAPSSSHRSRSFSTAESCETA